jgi:drug/metabolite transporter (DMT)-like permease
MNSDSESNKGSDSKNPSIVEPNTEIKTIPTAKSQEEITSSFYHSKLGILFAMVVLFGNGIHPIINNSRPIELNAMDFAWLMGLFEFLCVLPFFISEKIKKPAADAKLDQKTAELRRNAWKLYLTIGLFFSIAQGLYTEGLTIAGSINGSIATKTAPIFALFIGAIILGEKITKTQLGLTAIMLLGLYYQSTKGTFLMDQINIGFLMLCATAFLWNFSHALSKPFLQSGAISTSEIIFYRTSIVLISLLTFSIIQTGFEHVFSIIKNPVFIFYGVLMGGTYFFMHFCWYKSISTINLSLASALVIPSPVITTVIAILIGQDVLHGYQIIGMIIMVGGLYALLFNKMKTNHSNPPAK